MKARIVILMMTLMGVVSFAQSGEKMDVLGLNERSSPPASPIWGNGSLYFGSDGELYIKKSGVWTILGAGGSVTVDDVLNGSSSNPVENQALVAEFTKYPSLNAPLWTLTDPSANFDIKKGTDAVGTWDAINQLNFGDNVTSLSYRGTFINSFVGRAEINLWLDSAGDLLPVGDRPTTYVFDGAYDSDNHVPRKRDIDAAISGISGSGDSWSDPVDSNILTDGFNRNLGDNTISGAFDYIFGNRIVHRSTDGEYWVWDTTGGNDLGLFKNASETAATSAQWTFNATGTASAATDILKKSDGDALYSSGGGISPDNQEKIDNIRDVSFIDIAGNVIFSSENFTRSSSPDLKKMVINRTSPNDTILLPNLPVSIPSAVEAPQNGEVVIRASGTARFKIRGELVYRYEVSATNWELLSIIPQGDGITYRIDGNLVVGDYTLADTTPPSVPTNISSPAQTGGSITLNWDDATDNVAVTGYRIYRDAVEVGTSVTSDYVDTGLASSTSYAYTIASYDAATNESAQSTIFNQSTTSGASDPFVAQSFDDYFGRSSFATASNTDGESISEWQDIIDADVFTSNGAADPELDITNGFESAIFNGTDTWFGQAFGFAYDPAVDNMTVVLQIGSQAITQGAFYSRTSSSTGNGFYFLDPSSVSLSLEAKVGSSSTTANPAIAPGDLIIFECSPTGIDVYHNNILIVDDGPIGTTTSTINNNIGARTDGSFVLNGSLAIVARKMALLTAQERLDLYNFTQANQ